jgi:hypothetical protein
MHGDEPGGRMLLPMLAEWLCSKQTTDPRAARIINGMHLVSSLLLTGGGLLPGGVDEGSLWVPTDSCAFRAALVGSLRCTGSH